MLSPFYQWLATMTFIGLDSQKLGHERTENVKRKVTQGTTLTAKRANKLIAISVDVRLG
jgi:hypothetical protein